MRHLNLFAFSLIFSTSGYGLTINMTIEGEDIRVDNVSLQQAITENIFYYIPTSGETYAGLKPTKKWVPTKEKTGGYITFTNGSNQQVDVPMSTVGDEFVWEGEGFSHDTSDIPNIGYEKCHTSQIPSGVLVQNFASSYWCTSPYSLVSLKETIPFYEVRPQLVIRKSQTLAAFKGKPEGVYIGSIEFPVAYFSYDDSVQVFRKQTLPPMIVTFQIDYIPEAFTSLVVTSENDGKMPPEYGSGTVKGETRFNIETIGYFNTGIKMKFDTSKDYSLTHESQTDKKIPYYVHCDTCEDKVIVGDNGKVTTSVLNNAGVVLAPVGSDNTRINYNLTVGYSDKTVNEVVTGGYSDSFVVIFGLDF
ncbi:hypothetical protein DXJ84_20795 [Vibrio parahaemolyticus]|uniref:hypothetical protein n=1 Tax=Vibrio parahaemolyticus TaxID=670 RepID=UPI00111CD195|nr:hypothetical protein [Vibrio parahaemolyticus]TPA23132.1 hypothetical protein DXJ84_20795 [Vibrio parahaemolyticus]